MSNAAAPDFVVHDFVHLPDFSGNAGAVFAGASKSQLSDCRQSSDFSQARFGPVSVLPTIREFDRVLERE